MPVKPSKRGRPRKGDDKLSRDAIIEAARSLLWVESQPLSIRGLARHMQVDVMAIYHYFENKAALLEATTSVVMEDVYMPPGVGDWRAELGELCRSYVRLLGEHPGLLESLLSMGESARGPAAVFEARFDAATATLEMAVDHRQAALDLLVDYLHGFALALQSANDEFKPDLADIDQPLTLYMPALELASRSTFT